MHRQNLKKDGCLYDRKSDIFHTDQYNTFLLMMIRKRIGQIQSHADVAIEMHKFDDLTAIIKAESDKIMDVFVIMLSPEIARAKAQVAKSILVPWQSHH